MSAVPRRRASYSASLRRGLRDGALNPKPCAVPPQACELYSVPRHRALGMEGRGPAFSSFASGFLPLPALRVSRTTLKP